MTLTIKRSREEPLAYSCRSGNYSAYPYGYKYTKKAAEYKIPLPYSYPKINPYSPLPACVTVTIDFCVPAVIVTVAVLASPSLA